MKVQSFEDRTRWEAFLAAVQPPTFLQSWAWGEMQRALGEEAVRLAAVEGEAILGVTQAVTVTARRGKFLHVPHGPVLAALGRNAELGTRDSEPVFIRLVTALLDEARRLGCAFLRVSPIQENTPEHREWYRTLGFRRAPIHLHAERLWVLDLQPTEEELLAQMRKTTRNLVRRAEREGVVVRLGNDALEVFLRLYAETARRERFVTFPRPTIEAEVAAFSARPEGDFTVLPNTVKPDEVERIQEESDIRVAVAEQQGEPLSAAVVPLTAWSAFYHHGASVRTRRNVPAGYALQWALIREAKRRGCAQYNFWGVVQPDAPPSHPWHGLSLFKRGFGGREVPLVPTQDLPVSLGYWPAYAIDTLRRWKRGV